jgi:ABC-type glycerol-3-phosphate transport system substrate-binding protein
MKALFALSAAALLAAGCATTDSVQVAQAPDCKVVPITTYSATGKAKPVERIRQREAEMDLARTDYRFQQLARNGVFNNNVEEALRDCGQAR